MEVLHPGDVLVTVPGVVSEAHLLQGARDQRTVLQGGQLIVVYVECLECTLHGSEGGLGDLSQSVVTEVEVGDLGLVGKGLRVDGLDVTRGEMQVG